MTDDADPGVTFSYGELIQYIEQERELLFGPVRQPDDIDKNNYASSQGMKPKRAQYILDKLAEAGKLTRHEVYDYEQGRHVIVYRKPG